MVGIERAALLNLHRDGVSPASIGRRAASPPAVGCATSAAGLHHNRRGGQAMDIGPCATRHAARSSVSGTVGIASRATGLGYGAVGETQTGRQRGGARSTRSAPRAGGATEAAAARPAGLLNRRARPVRPKISGSRQGFDRHTARPAVSGAVGLTARATGLGYGGMGETQTERLAFALAPLAPPPAQRRLHQ